MQYRIDERNQKQLSILGFGCMRFPQSMGSIDMKKTEEMLLYAIEQGINYFDTAYMYPGSEKALGTILAKHQFREQVYIATKLPIYFCKKPQDLDKYFEKELERLQTNYIDYYLLHMLTDMESWEHLKHLGIEEWVRKKKESGQIRQFGFSFHGIRDAFLNLLDVYDWDFTQIQYNYSDEHFQAGITGLRKAAKKGIPVIIMEPLLGGKLVNNLPAQAVEILNEANPKLSPAAWALRWLWNQPEVTVVLSGMSNMEQVKDNIATASQSSIGMLTDQDTAALEKVTELFKGANKVPCTGCNYCMPCPQNINIPNCFSAYNAYYAINKMTGRQQYTLGTGQIQKTQNGASLCIKCGKCEKHCPQSIPIIKELAAVNQTLEPVWYKGLMKAARFLLRK